MQAVPATAASQQPAAAPAAASADAVAAWFTEALGTHCSLVRQQPGARTAFHTRRRHSQDSSSNGEPQETIGAWCDGLPYIAADSVAVDRVLLVSNAVIECLNVSTLSGP